MMRRAMTSGRRLIGLPALTFLSHSLTSERARARLIAGSEVRRCLSQPKPCRPIAHSSDGGEISKGERPSQTATLPEKTKRPEWISAACVASAVRKSCGAITSRSFLPENSGSRWIQKATNWPSSARRSARARNRESLACSVTETRDIDGPFSSSRSRPAQRDHTGAPDSGQLHRVVLRHFQYCGDGFSATKSCHSRGSAQITGARCAPHRSRPYRLIVALHQADGRAGSADRLRPPRTPRS